MIIYNVTCNLHPRMAEEWLAWMKEEHIPEVMQSGCFTECKILKLLTEAEDNDGVNYAIQYTAWVVTISTGTSSHPPYKPKQKRNMAMMY